MTELKVTFRFDDEELNNAIRFIGGNDETIPLIREDFFLKDAEIDFRKLPQDQQRYFHQNGIAAMLVTIQEELNKLYATNTL
jgi:hypothetical protein